LVLFFASTIDTESAFAWHIQNRCRSHFYGPTNVLNVFAPDSQTSGCSYSYELKQCDELWGPKTCAQANDPYRRSPSSMHIVVTIYFTHTVDRNSLRPLMPPGSPDATVALAKSGDPPGVIPIDILPIQCHADTCYRDPNVLFTIRSLKPYTDPDVLGLCGVAPFFLHLGQVRDIKGSILDGDYDGIPGGNYHMRFSPPPC
jgi:hypothetical protein